MKANEVLDRLGISRVTLCKYVKSGIIKADKLGNGQYNYDEESIYEFLGQKFDRKQKSMFLILEYLHKLKKISLRSRLYEYIIHV